MRIRLAQASDVPQLMAMSEADAGAAHWSQQQWLDIFKAEIEKAEIEKAEIGHGENAARMAWVAEAGIAEAEAGGIGFLVAQNCGPEWELENIAVLPDCRRRGVGLGLMAALLAQARGLRAERILLEVRESNEAAIRLYEVSGFEMLARRRDYYRNPPEDALIMVQSL
jgi:ribosomal-protein-alanine N-acetyltransferase